MSEQDAGGALHIPQVERWGRFEKSYAGPQEGNPFQDVTFGAVFRNRNRTIKAEGFYDGGGVYKLRFMPDEEGIWTYRTTSSREELDGLEGSFQTGPALAGNHGPVEVVDAYRFAYRDSTPYLPFGTTLYHWFHHGEPEREERTLAVLASQPFNKVRMCVLPTGDMDPPALAFAGSLSEGADTSRFNPAFFYHLEKRLEDLLQLGIEADIILFHPYDRGVWGFQQLEPEVEEAYLRYVIARLSSYRNVWWSIANEFDFNKHKTMEDWDRLFCTVQHFDPYGRLRSIHNGTKMYDYDRTSTYDYNKPWVTHQSIQHWETAWTGHWLEQCPKPVVVDECCYEGDAPRRWGNLSGRVMLRRFWEGAVRGGYVSHGEAYGGEHTWISRGGELAGESPARIAFLRRQMERGQADLWNLPDRRSLYWIYFGVSQPGFWDLELPEGQMYRLEIIDTWGMTVEPLEGSFSGRIRVPLPGRPDLALRIEAVSDSPEAAS